MNGLIIFLKCIAVGFLISVVEHNGDFFIERSEIATENVIKYVPKFKEWNDYVVTKSVEYSKDATF